jgi:hypothetical protein
MRKRFAALVAMSLMASLFSAQFDPKKYEPVEIEKLKATPEDLKNKKVTFETVYWRYETTFPPYIERSGYKAGKDYYLAVDPGNFPVMADKTDEMNAIIPTLKRGSKIRVYGKVKKFSSPPVETRFPHYFLELDKLEIIEIGDGSDPDEKIPDPVKRKTIKRILEK